MPTSMELPSLLILGAMLLTLYLTGSQMMQWFVTQMREGLVCDRRVFSDPGAFVGFMSDKFTSALWVIAPLIIGIAAAGIAGNLIISGWNVASKGIKPRLDTLNPVNGIKQLFSSRSLVHLGLSIVKLAFIGFVVYSYLRGRIDELAALRWTWSTELMAAVGGLIFGIVARILLGILVIAVADAVYQKWKYIHELKMTKQEVKEERRQDEGSPEVKRRVRLVQFEMVRRRMMQQVPKANVVLVNPTHVAVALRYDAGEMAAPTVVAKGGDILAEKIKEIARAHGVPIIRRRELARTIYDTVEVDRPIPEGLYVAVAEILAMIHRLRKRRQ